MTRVENEAFKSNKTVGILLRDSWKEGKVMTDPKSRYQWPFWGLGRENVIGEMLPGALVQSNAQVLTGGMY